MAKRKRTSNGRQNYTENYSLSNTNLSKNVDGLNWSGRVSSSCSTSDALHIRQEHHLMRNRV